MSSTTLISGPIGWFGKFPALGDFVQRHLPDSFVPAWDAWLQGGMAAASQQQGEEWKDNFLRFPVWYFLRGVPDQESVDDPHRLWAGMLVPSADRVGRLYPLTIAFDLPAELFLQLGFALLENRLEEIEGLVLDVLSTDDMPKFEQALADMAPISSASASKPLHTVAPAALLQRLGAQTMLAQLRDNTLFWAPDAGPAEPLMLAAEPLQAETFCKLVLPSTASLMAE
jgi:type VI secretion system protein ImpM